jgi:uncharacterized Zn finger protein
MVLKGLNIDGVIKVYNARVYGLEESIVASGYPMQIETFNIDEIDLIDKDIKRAKHLGNAVPGSGHDCFLKGIIVQFDLQVPEYIWRQLDRYHFIDYISSQSKMHRITKINLDSVCNRYVYDEVKEILKSIIDKYEAETDTDKKKELFNEIIANTPAGLMLTARMTTNYLQLKSIINQRSNHKMQEWRYLCDWFKTLPMLEELVCKKQVSDV